jgi:hypothetical protein
MKKLIFIILPVIMTSCNQKTTDFELITKKCVVDTIVYKGQHSTIEPDLTWEIRTDCGVNIITKQGNKYIKGDTITFLTKKYNEKRNF